MLHPEVLEQIIKEKSRDGFVYPFYNKYSIAELAPSIQYLFGTSPTRPTLPHEFFKGLSQPYKKIITFIVDGFGYQHFAQYHEKLSFFNRLQNAGDVYPITSVFPSTTPAALTTIYTGLTPQEHGLPEWTVYFEEFDAIIEPLLFRKQKAGARDSLVQAGGKPEMLFEGKTIFSQLTSTNITSYNFIFEEYFPSTYSTAAFTGSHVQTFKDGVDLMAKLRATIETTTGPAYFFVYWSAIDSAEHSHGPHSLQHTRALAEFSNIMEHEFLQKIQPAATKDTLLILSADHGQTMIRGEDILYLGKYVYLNDNYSRMKNGHSILPTGAPHDVFLFIDPVNFDQILQLLKKDLEGKAEVLTTAEAISRGLFGVNSPSQRFINRIGNILILPYPSVHIWYEHFPAETFSQLGTHGGLSADEMIVPVALADLQKLLP